MNKKQIKLNNMMEIVWVLVFILCLVISIKQTMLHGFKDSILFYAITILALLMYAIRRYMRKNQQKVNK